MNVQHPSLIQSRLHQRKTQTDTGKQQNGREKYHFERGKLLKRLVIHK
jgi:hypothetical protein